MRNDFLFFKCTIKLGFSLALIVLVLFFLQFLSRMHNCYVINELDA